MSTFYKDIVEDNIPLYIKIELDDNDSNLANVKYKITIISSSYKYRNVEEFQNSQIMKNLEICILTALSTIKKRLVMAEHLSSELTDDGFKTAQDDDYPF